MRIVYHHRTRSTDAQRVHIQEMVEAFRALGNEVTVVSLVPTDRGQGNAKRDAGNPFWQRSARRIPLVYEAIQLAYNLLGVPMLAREVLRRKTDLIYERYSLFNFTGAIVSKLCRIPLVLEVNSPFWLEQGRDGDIMLSGLAKWTERMICNLAERVLAVSTPLARILQASGVRPEKIEVMTNGVRLEQFVARPPSAELRASLGIRPGERVIGFAGWFREWHGIEMLIEAFQISGLGNDGARLLLIGDGQAMKDLRDFARERELGSSVIFTGPVPHASMPRYLDLVDIAVQPAANEYCCPMKILEYMALAKPIVAPRQPNIQEILREGEASLFEPHNARSLAGALREVARDAEAARRMGAHAREAITTRGYLWTANAARVA
ncbi:MAG TPA: glycosyltransferase family 4 protein [Bryobacteraceae bacterium]|jgi:glycosyltransferase involved in cell wall biosynthesis